VRPGSQKGTGRTLGLALALLLAAPVEAAEPQPQMTGDVQIHDPSVIEIGGQFVAVGTGQQGPTHGAIRAKSGKLLRADEPPVALASRHGGAIEAASILEHDGRFTLFASFDQCCKGVASTYNIRVGRADRIEGPYRDRDGKAMLEGGGSALLATAGRFIGPGGQEAVKTSKGDWLAYHYYDGDGAGASKLQFSPIIWSAEGWPQLGPLPQ
jgi:arabinan endo-1,5-alpha-L-arabinosidase